MRKIPSFSLIAHYSPLITFLMVGARRFELPTPCAQGRCATRLRYAPSKTRAILHREGTKSRFCGTRKKLRQDLYQLLERFAPVADLCFRFAVKFAESFS